MTRHKCLLNKVSSFLVVLSSFVCKEFAYDIESAMKIATVGPNVYLGSEGIKECDEELGVSSHVKLVPDSGMTASSHDRNYPPHEGRLLSDKWWQPGIHERGQFLMVDLQQLTVVRQSAVQGGRDTSVNGARVLSYFIYHSINGEIWFPILEREHVKLFMGNIENSELISRDYFPEPVMARFIKFYPQKWRTLIALRVELYGCPAGFDPPLGMSSQAISDAKISASSAGSNSSHPKYGRLNLQLSAGGWCALEQNTKQYFQILLAVDDWSSTYIISAVATQGVLTKKSWVKSYYFSHTNTTFTNPLWTFYHDKDKRKLFVGNTDENTVVTNHFMGFIDAKQIRIHPQTWENTICLRAEVYGIKHSRDATDDHICKYGPDKTDKCHGDGKACIASPSETHQIFTCVCGPGYQGSTRSCRDIDECSMTYPICTGKEHTCFNVQGYFECHCAKGYFIDQETKDCKDIDECAGLNARDVCPYLTDCINTDGSFFCDCNEPGYRANANDCLGAKNVLLCGNGRYYLLPVYMESPCGPKRIDIDECEIGNHTCLANSTCVNAAGSFRCFCNKGFTGDGSKACYDIDECKTAKYECGDYTVCVNTVGSYSCVCRKGFVARGAECEDLDECGTQYSVCQDTALCVNLPGSYACQCRPGFHITDLACEDINECQQTLAECDKQADCYNTVGSYLCVCNKGLYGDGFYCSESALGGQCLEGDEECAAALSERTRGRSYARPNRAARDGRLGKLQTDVVNSEGSSDNTQEKVDADEKTKNSEQSFLKLNKWIFMFPAILFTQLLRCG